MSRIYTNSSDKVCSLCGQHHATAEWHGYTDVQICCECAEDSLPGLIADAVVINSPRDAFRVIERITQRYWRAVALRVMNEKREVPDDSFI